MSVMIKKSRRADGAYLLTAVIWTLVGWSLGMLTDCAPHAPTPIPADVEACPAACAVLIKTPCPEGQPSPGGVPCAAWCADYHRAGYMRPWAGCVAVTTPGDVDGIRACGVSCE